MSSSNTYNTPCAACKFLRRKCMPGCIFAPYFPPEEPQKFVNVHKIFGANNITKLLNDILPHQREDAVNSLAYEAEARVRDPVYGCVGAISFLQMQVDRLQKELDAANADLIRLACSDHHSHINISAAVLPPPPPPPPTMLVHRQRPLVRLLDHHGEGRGASSTNNTTTNLNTTYQTHSTLSFTYPLPWASYDQNNSSTGNINGGGGVGGGRIN